MPERARALWFVGPRAIELRDETLPAPGAEQVLVRALASGVSQGTELLLYRGEGPADFDRSLDASAPATSTYPRRYGYAWVGEVAETAGTAGALAGKRVFGLLPHGEAHVVDARRVHVLADDVPPPRAVLFANLETAITITWDAEAAFGEHVVVLGGGVVGQLTALLLARSGARVTLVERSAARRAVATSLLGGDLAITGDTDAIGDADVVVEATGDPAALDVAIRVARPEGRIVVASFYGARRAAIDLGDRFHRARLTLRSSQVSEIPPRMRPRWTYERRTALVGELLHDAALDVLLAPPVPFTDAADLYDRLSREDDLPPAHVFVYR